MIKTKEIDKYIRNVLLKRKDENLTEEDLKNIKKIALSGVDFAGEKILYNFEDIGKLTNLETCTLELFDINDEIILNLNTLTHLKELNISHCKFLCENKIVCDLEKLIISYTELDKFIVLGSPESIETLELINVGKFDFSILENMKNVKKLYIYNSEVNNIELIEKFTSLELLKLDGTKIDNENILKNLGKRVKIQRKDKFLIES